MMPEPTTVATRMPVPRASENSRRDKQSDAGRHQAADAGEPAPPVLPMASSRFCKASMSTERTGNAMKIEMRLLSIR